MVSAMAVFLHSIHTIAEDSFLFSPSSPEMWHGDAKDDYGSFARHR